MLNTLSLLRDLEARGERVHGDPAGPAVERLRAAMDLIVTCRALEAEARATVLGSTCRSCSGPAHPATGCQFSATYILCGPCARVFHGWARSRFHWMASLSAHKPGEKKRAVRAARKERSDA